MINTLIIYNPYILYSRIYPPNNNWKVKSAFTTLIEPFIAIISDRTYNMDISLPLNYQSPRTIISVESSSDCILGFPLFVQSFYETCIQKVYLAKKIQGYILSIIFIISKLLYFLRGKLK